MDRQRDRRRHHGHVATQLSGPSAASIGWPQSRCGTFDARQVHNLRRYQNRKARQSDCILDDFGFQPWCPAPPRRSRARLYSPRLGANVRSVGAPTAARAKNHPGGRRQPRRAGHFRLVVRGDRGGAYLGYALIVTCACLLLGTDFTLLSVALRVGALLVAVMLSLAGCNSSHVGKPNPLGEPRRRGVARAPGGQTRTLRLPSVRKQSGSRRPVVHQARTSATVGAPP